MFERIMMTKPTLFRTWQCVRLLHFTSQNKRHHLKETDDFGVILFQIYYSKYVYYLLLQYKKIWQSYWQNKMAQFLPHSV